MENILEISNLVYEYTGEDKESIQAVKDVSLQISKGEFVVIIGHNGSGKSTLAKHVNALLLPSSGKVFVMGLDTSDDSFTWQIRQTAGMVFQNPDRKSVV